MKRLRRWLFDGIAALSLVISVAMTALWLRSFFAVESVSRIQWDATTRRISEVSMVWSDGRFVFYMGRVAPPALGFSPPSNVGWQHSTTSQTPRDFALWQVIHQPKSYFLGANGTRGWSEVWSVAFRIWLLAVLAALLPVLWLFGKIRQTRLAQNVLCHYCGYDLRATPDRCPECGTVPEKAK
jgi:hypothetical protein